MLVTDRRNSPVTLFVLLALLAALLPFIAVTAATAAGPPVFINEIHYDNTGVDTGEGVEIAGPAGTNLASWSIVLYNGNSGGLYNTIALSGTIPDLQAGFGTLSFSQAGIQNGSPDGLALVDASSIVVEFLSYEGSFVAIGGPASGMLSTVIGVSEVSSTPVGDSLQLIGTGTMGGDFSWAAAQPHTFGSVNTGQTFGAPAPAQLVINEIDYDQPSSDTAEFVEIKNTGGTSENLSTWTVEFVNGTGGGAAVYDTIALPNVQLAAGDYFVVCANAATVPNCDLDDGPNTNFIQNGAPDAVGLRDGGTLMDAVSYEGDTGAPYTEGSGSGLEDNSRDGLGIARCDDGADTDQNNVDFLGSRPITPGATNNCDLTSPFELVINEIIQNPAAVFDSNGEWFEVHNPTGSAIDIDGFTIKDDDSDSHVISNGGPLLVAAGGFVVLARNDNFGSNGGVTVDYEYSGFFLGNSADEVILLDGSLLEVDRVEYDNGATFPDENGKSMALRSPALDNNVGFNWCISPNPFGDGDLGSPGAANDCLTTQVGVQIHDIQAAAHRSPFENGSVSGVDGFVTTVAGNGFYLQEQDDNVDSDIGTSEGIFVFTAVTPLVAVGDSLVVAGNVGEFQFSPDLSTTEIRQPLITTGPTGTPPTTRVIGIGGRIPPGEVIDDDGLTSFDPEDDGIDFYESLEGMLVQINDGVVIDPTNRFGEIGVVSDNGANAAARTNRGGMLIAETDDDFNPEIVLLDDALIPTPDASVGDLFDGSIVGVMSYSFGAFKLLPTALPSLVSGGLGREVTTAQGENELAVATFNVLNLDPFAPGAKYADLADVIVTNMQAPDIIGLQEIQDNSGTSNDGTVSASDTYAALIAAIATAGGPAYDFREVAPADLMDGGQPGANIRVGFLFRTDRVTFVDRGSAGATDATAAVPGLGGVELTLSPGRVDPANTAFDDSRKPLAGEFRFRGETYIVVVNHFNSKGGDDGLYGEIQPPMLNTEPQRDAIAQVVNDFADSVLAVDADANLVVLGDLNEFHFRQPLSTLEGGVLTNLIDQIAENDRYTFIFNGNSQTLDHILVNDAVVLAGVAVDFVHANIDFPEEVISWTDHDPIVARITLMSPMEMKGVAVNGLEALLPTGDNNTDTRIDKAIDRIGESLNPDWWVTESEISNKQVFDGERQAVVQLELVVASGVPQAGDAQVAIDLLVEADRRLAQVAIDAAIAGGGNPGQIAEAQVEMAAAAADVAAGLFNEAVNSYKTAWDKATKAL